MFLVDTAFIVDVGQTHAVKIVFVARWCLLRTVSLGNCSLCWDELKEVMLTHVHRRGEQDSGSTTRFSYIRKMSSGHIVDNGVAVY